MLNQRQMEFAVSMADYMMSHVRYEELTKREAVIEAMSVLMGDIGAAQAFLNAIGLDVDLYTTELLPGYEYI